MCLHTCNTILEKDNTDQKVILQGRKSQLSGKWQVINGKHLMTGAELIEVREAEEVTKQRKAPKKGTRKQKGRSTALTKESSDESEAYLDITDDKVEIFDCIEVEM
jgi:hypothetical protein